MFNTCLDVRKSVSKKVQPESNKAFRSNYRLIVTNTTEQYLHEAIFRAILRPMIQLLQQIRACKKKRRGTLEKDLSAVP